MRVLVYEPFAAGHRFHYVRLLVEALDQLPVSIHLATTRNALESGNFKVHLKGVKANMEVVEIPEVRPGNRILRAMREYARIRKTTARIQPDHFMIPTASQFVDAFALANVFGDPFSEAVTEGLFLSHGFGYELSNFRQRLSTKYQAAVERSLKFEQMAYIDAIQLRAMRNHSPGFADKSVVIPDPAPVAMGVSKSVAREELGIPVEGSYLGVTGAINEDKGVDDLLRAFQIALPSLPSDARVLLAGKCSAGIRRLLRSEFEELTRSDRLICLDRLLNTREMLIALPALDLLCASHRGRPGPSGAIVRANAAGVPILGRDRYWTQAMVDNFDLGWTCKTHDHQVFAAAIVKYLPQAIEYTPSSRARELAKFNDERNFKANWTSLLRKRLGIPSDPNLVLWDWDSLKAEASL